MKFGGSSVADSERMARVAAIVAERARTMPVVVVVSAMGKTTNALLAEARAIAPEPPARELDMLLSTGERHAMALLALHLHARGVAAVSLTGSQCGIITDHRHGRARVMEVRPFRIADELAAGKVVIVGGFQGVSYRREVTTLGRGGSDTTAVALAAALQADCEIYSDVDGVYSADPREVPGAHRLATLDDLTAQALSRAGAKVLHAQAVQLAAVAGIAIYARATDGGGGETVIRRGPVTGTGVVAVTSEARTVRLRIEPGVPTPPPLAAIEAWFGLGLRDPLIDAHGASGVFARDQHPDPGDLLERVEAIARGWCGGSATVTSDERESLVSCVGAGIEQRPDVVAQALALLRAAAIEVLGVQADTHTLALRVPAHHRAAAVRALHDGLIGAEPRAAALE
jgi:aspartate kinase